MATKKTAETTVQPSLPAVPPAQPKKMNINKLSFDQLKTEVKLCEGAIRDLDELIKYAFSRYTNIPSKTVIHRNKMRVLRNKLIARHVQLLIEVQNPEALELIAKLLKLPA